MRLEGDASGAEWPSPFLGGELNQSALRCERRVTHLECEVKLITRVRSPQLASLEVCPTQNGVEVIVLMENSCVSCPCCDKLPPTGWLRTTHIYPLQVRNPKFSFCKSEIQNQFHWVNIKVSSYIMTAGVISGGSESVIKPSRPPFISCVSSLVHKVLLVA